MRLTLCLAALAASVAIASPAQAQLASANAEARGVVLQPLTLTRLEHLDFGWVISTVNAGTVAIDPDNGARSFTGGVTPVVSYPGGRGLFAGAGSANQQVILSFTPPSALVSTTNPGDTINVASMTLDNGNALVRTINSTGVFQVGVGGEFDIAANQPNGLYMAQFTLTADYQ